MHVILTGQFPRKEEELSFLESTDEDKSTHKGITGKGNKIAMEGKTDLDLPLDWGLGHLP